MTRWRIDPRHQADVQLALGLLFPAVAGLLLFGWRCVGVWAAILTGASLARVVIGRLRSWTGTPGVLALVVQCVVVGLFCPATLFDAEQATFQTAARWPALVAIGAFVALVDWLRRTIGGRRFHPAVLAAAVLTLGVPAVVRTDRVLPPQKLVVGDILDPKTVDRASGTAEPWLDTSRGTAAVLVTPPAERSLTDYLHDRPPAGRTNQTINRLLSDDLPPLEDLIVGGHPTALGRGSVVMLLIGGLFLVYRGLTPLRVPALAMLACYATLALLPLPIGVGDGGGRRWLFERDPRVGWAAGLTLVHYLLAASSVPLTATFLLPQPGVRPTGRRVAAVFAIAFGVLAAVATVFVSVGGGAVLALLLLQASWPKRRSVPASLYSRERVRVRAIGESTSPAADLLPNFPPEYREREKEKFA